VPVVEEDDTLRDLLGYLVRRFGFGPILITSSKNVSDTARAATPGVILLDIWQRHDGPDIVARLRTDPTTKHLPIVILVDDIGDHRCRCVGSNGARSYIGKPFGLGQPRQALVTRVSCNGSD
jgi:two-component system alkaline phosphatase synthesis response regulator PhoP